MPPSVNRLLLTSLHSLLIVAMILGSLAPLAVVAAPMSADSARPVSQELPTWDESPEPVIPIPTPETPVDPNLLQEAIPWIGPNSDGASPTIPIATPEQADVPAREPATAPVITIPDGEGSGEYEVSHPATPLDDLYGEMTPEERDPFAGSYREPTLPLVPVAVKVELDRYVLAQDEQATLHVRIGRANDDFSGNVIVTLTLPPQLRIVGEIETTRVWSYDADDLGAPIHQTYDVQVDPSYAGALPAVADIGLEVSAENYSVRRSQWSIGITGAAFPSDGNFQHQAMQAAEGAVLEAHGLTLLLPAGAAPANTQINYTPLYTATALANDPETSAEISLTIALTEGQQLLLPSVRQVDHSTAAETTTTVDATVGEEDITSPSIPTLQDHGVGVYRLWHLSANGATLDEVTSEGQEGTSATFEVPLTMVVDVADLIAANVDMSLVRLWTRPNATQMWAPVRSARYDSERQVVVAQLNHFSDYALGIAPTATGDFLPSMKGFSSDRHTGAVTINYPIVAPNGLGGLNPNLSLNYSTATVDELQFILEPEGEEADSHVQASVAGYGWNLTGLNYITLSRDEEFGTSYSLVLNGQTYDLFKNHDVNGRFVYETNPYSFAAITHTFTVSQSVWQIKTADGLLYEFGGDLPNMEWDSTAENERWSFVEMRSNLITDTRTFEVSAWYLQRVEDTVGNTMQYSYLVQRADISDSNCFPDEYTEEEWSDAYEDSDNPWYTRAAYLTDIIWSGNTGKHVDNEQPVAPTLHIRLDYTGRTDYDKVTTQDCQPHKTNKRLEAIYVEAKATEGDEWHRLRSYSLVTDYAVDGSEGSNYLRHLRLRQIQEYGTMTETTSLLNTYTFTYTQINQDFGDTEYKIFLTTADNGFRGKVTYEYGAYDPVCIIDHGETTSCGELGQRYAVIRTRTEDGQGFYYFNDYGYIDDPHIVVHSSRMYNFGFRRGTNKVYNRTINAQPGTGVLVEKRYEEYDFYQFDGGILTQPDSRHTRLKELRVYDKSGTGKILYSYINFVWRSQISTGTVFSDAIWLDDQAHWIWLERQDEWTRGTFSNGSGTQKRFYYDPAAQGGGQFGNITAVEEYSHPEFDISYATWQSRAINNNPPLNFYRRTETTYFPNTAGLADRNLPYIVDRPARVMVKSGGGVCYSENRSVYIDYDATVQNRDGAYNVPPATTLIAKNAQVVSGCPLNGDTATGREDSAFLVTSYAYDDYGNQVSSVSHDGDNDIVIQTAYDDFYHLFPVERWNNADDDLKARASYYGVDSVAVDSVRGFWGAMSETCEINNVCTRFGYDQFGRKVHQWDRQLASTPLPANSENEEEDVAASSAAIRWIYRKPGEINPAQKSYIVTEWHAPRCEGNWIRRHYNGLGQLVVEQKSYQDYEYEIDGCGDADDPEGHEIVTYFDYQTLGYGVMNQSAPRLEKSSGGGGYLYYAPTPNFTVTYRSNYDPLGRFIDTTAPNKDYILTQYSGRRTVEYTNRTLGGAEDYKVQRWLEFNPLGYMQNVRSITRHNNDWFMYGLVELTHNVVGNMTQAKYSHFPTQPSTYTYDQSGRMTAMNDMDMGSWSYTYNRHSQLTQQKDARNISTCLFYDDFGRLRGKRYTNANVDCPTAPSFYDDSYEYGSSGIEAGQLTLTSARIVGANEVYSKTLEYNVMGQVSAETVDYLNWNPLTTAYGYDSYGRVEAITYPDSEVITYAYNGMGLHSAITSSVKSTIADAIGYDVLGRASTMRLTADITSTKSLSVTNAYYEWGNNSPNGNARLRDITVTLETQGNPDVDLLALGYRYDYHGNIQEIDEQYNGGYQATHTFEYDILNHLREANYTAPITVTAPYTFHASGRLNTFDGKTYAYASDPVLAPSQVTRVSDGQQLVFTYDANGNMTQRQYFDANGVKRTQTLTWGHANDLATVNSSSPYTYNTFVYDANQVRTAQVDVKGGDCTCTIYPFPFYDLTYTQPGNTLTPTRYYLLNGNAIALRIGSESVTYLHRDHLGSVVMSTQGGAISDSRMYYAYGEKRGGDEYPFDANYTGQRLDDTGLLYYNARFYDPQLGVFISPDSMIPDPTDYYSYNRYLYVRGNPIRNNDPTGHIGEPGAGGGSGWLDRERMNEYIAGGNIGDGDTYSTYLRARGQFEIYRGNPDLYYEDDYLSTFEGDTAAGLRLADAQLYASYYLNGETSALPMALYRLEEQQQMQFVGLASELPQAAPGAMMATFGTLFAKAGINVEPHFLKRLASRSVSRGITEEAALRAYNRGRLFYDNSDGRYIRYDPQSGVVVVVDAPTNGTVVSVFEADKPSSRWNPIPWRPGTE